MKKKPARQNGIAIIGMAGRFPGAANVAEFWSNLVSARESITTFSAEDELADDPEAGLGVGGATRVRARGLIDKPEYFDAEFFGINPREADIIDPQHRVFLECAWEALENAGCDPARFAGAIGVFAGMSMNTYLSNNLRGRRDLFDLMGPYVIMLGNDKDFLPTRVSHKLNLRGPSLNIQTACSTSLAAVCVACEQLLGFQCDIALAGAVALSFPRRRGYDHQPGGIGSPDGHCRAFDASAAGTTPGEGVGVVVLKREDDAVADGDFIHAVIRGFGVNNDGGLKAGYTAPSVEGQAEAILLAHAMAGFAPETLGYIEAHGTGTPLGDPIELTALEKAFRTGTKRKQFCGIGSVKTNIGHLDTAAGIAGLIKTALALQHHLIPPSLHFQKPNPQFDLANSPFQIVTKPLKWENGKRLLRAGVSSFGVGGTNTHLALEEAPVRHPARHPARAVHLLTLSARTKTALDVAAKNLAARLEAGGDSILADAAYTLQTGRKAFAHRRFVVCRSSQEGVNALRAPAARDAVALARESENHPVVFLFPGQGDQRPGMASELYEAEPLFRREIDACARLLEPRLGMDLRDLLLAKNGRETEAGGILLQTRFAQPALFVMQWTLARLWESWGVRPAAMLGHSLGEYTAACLAGVFSRDDALRIVAERGRLMQATPPGAMLAVRLSPEDAALWLGPDLSLAAINGPSACVLSGSNDAVSSLESRLTKSGVACRRLATSRAFHSALVEPVRHSFADLMGSVSLAAPVIPFISNVTGTWIEPGTATSPEYWADHLRQTVQFSKGLETALQDPGCVALEIGPGRTLSHLARQHPARQTGHLILASLVSDGEKPALDSMLESLGRIWLTGLSPDWPGLHQGWKRFRVPLPTYPFERKKYWVEPLPLFSGNHVVENKPAPNAFPVDPANADDQNPCDDTVNPSESPTTRRLRETLAPLLGVAPARIDPQTSFINLGFDSLLLAQASHAIAKSFEVTVDFRRLIAEFPSAETLAAHLDDLLATTRQPALAVPDVSPRDPASRASAPATLSLPLTESQHEIWVAAQMGDSASRAFNESVLVTLPGRVEIPVLLEALQALVDRHEALRSHIATDGTIQSVSPSGSVDWNSSDLSSLDEPARAAELDRLLRREAEHCFDLARGPALRATLAALEEGRHALAVTIHHARCDGHSLGILLRDLAEGYSRRVKGGALPGRPSFSFSQFVSRACKEESARPGEPSDWMARFAAPPEPLALPSDRPRPARQSLSGKRLGRTLAAPLRKKLARLSSDSGTTLFTTLLTAYFELLGRLSGQEDLLVGIPIARRNQPGSEGLVGHCVQFLPFRFQRSPEQSFLASLGRCAKKFWEDFEYASHLSGRLWRKQNAPAEPASGPAIAATFNFERIFDRLDFAGLEAAVTSNPHAHSHFDLSLNVGDDGRELRLDARFSTELFDPETIERWLGHYETLLESIALRPEASACSLPWLRELELQKLVLDWNQTGAQFPSEECLHQLFERQAERTPDAIAVVSGRESCSFTELNRRADEIAERLRTAGLAPGSVAGLCSARSLDLIAAIIGILKTGAAYLPVDPLLPPSRINSMLADCETSVVVTDTQHKSRLAGFPGKLFCLDELSRKSEPRTEPDSPAPSRPQDVAYVLYTSGSTGKPKGARVSHRSVVNCLWSFRKLLGINPRDAILGLTTLSFDIAALEIFLPLISGARLELTGPEEARDMRKLAEIIDQRGITLVQATPSTWRLLIESGWDSHSGLKLISGGEALSRRLASQLLAGGGRLWNAYGPTETTIWSSVGEVFPGDAPIRLGRPINNTQIYLLDSQHQPAPVGVPAEIHIGGEGVALGYLHRPELTAARFGPNPFVSGGRLYQTGDWGRRLPDGNIEFLGRADQQVKVAGRRIEMGEIESALDQYPGVREAAVTIQQTGDSGSRLVGYVAAAEEVSFKQLRDFLLERLPEYMAPSAWVRLDSLPRTANSKLDRAKLPRWQPERPEPGNAGRAPRDDGEEVMAALWEEVLGIDGLGIDDNFFQLGGDSMSALKLVARINRGLGLASPLSDLFQNPTVAGLVEALRRAPESRDKLARAVRELLHQASVESANGDSNRTLLTLNQP